MIIAAATDAQSQTRFIGSCKCSTAGRPSPIPPCKVSLGCHEKLKPGLFGCPAVPDFSHGGFSGMPHDDCLQSLQSASWHF